MPAKTRPHGGLEKSPPQDRGQSMTGEGTARPLIVTHKRPGPGDEVVPAPKIDCVQVPVSGDLPLEDLRRAFRTAAPLELGQAWLKKTEADFAPGRVQTAWREQSLLVLAQLTDADIFTGVTGLNQKAWLLGDTFEIFLRPVGQPAYIEFHVTPNNRHLQLRFPNAEAAARAGRPGILESLMVPGEVFHSRTWVQPEARQWFVFAEIPAGAVCAAPTSLAGCRWHFSFSRYDYTRGRGKPVISSTSPHAVASFHRQEEWGVMTFR